MKVTVILARILLGFVFAAAGLFDLLNLGKLGGLPPDAMTFLSLLVAHHYTPFIGLIMLCGGVLLLVGRFVPIGLVLLGPILINILLFHFMFHAPGVATGLVCTVLEIFLIWAYRSSFRGIFVAAPDIG